MVPTRHFALASLLWLAACSEGGFAELPFDPYAPGGGPGGTPWSGDEDPSCAADGDCLSGEACVDGVCQMKRCGRGPYSSSAPLADAHTFRFDRETIIADALPTSGSSWVDGYAPSFAGASYANSWDVLGPIVDIAGGSFYAERPEAIAVATSGSTSLALRHGVAEAALEVGFVPVALAAGDVDDDQRDEILVLGANGQVALCSPSACDTYSISGSTGIDAAAADVDGDGTDEPILLLDIAGVETLYVWNTNAALSGEPAIVTASAGRALGRIDAGDLDGDGTAEIIGLEDAGMFGWYDDHLALYRVGASISESAAGDVHADSIDIAIADADADDRAELTLLRSDGYIEVMGGIDLVPMWSVQLGVTGEATRVASVDFDGDSPRGRLIEGPSLVAGEVVPLAVLELPPYDAEHSAGVSSLYVGQSNVSGEALTDTLSLSLGVEVGYQADLFSMLSAGVGVSIDRELSRSRTEEATLSVGERFTMQARPETHGPDYAAVALACGCYHAYTYELDDPGDKLGRDRSKFVMLVPVDGQTTLWSSRRYNAMAEAIGGMPRVETTGKIGEPDSYSASLELAGGGAVSPEDVLFSEPPTLMVGDVGGVGWWLAAGDSATNETVTSTSLSLKAHVTVAGFSLGGSTGQRRSSSYSLNVGSEACFSGEVPPIPDDPSTPEDEYLLHRFSVTPWVYRRHYSDRAGNDAAYYVLSYTVTR